MLITLVTYNRPRWAAAIVAHLLEEAGGDARIVVIDNGQERPLMRSAYPARFGWSNRARIIGADESSIRTEMAGLFHRSGAVLVVVPGENVGAGGGRNLVLRWRLPGEPFVRLDDDWLPTRHGWLEYAAGVASGTRSGLVRLGGLEHTEGERAAPQDRAPRWRSPDTCGPLWYVTGECADHLGGFYLGFGATLLDDLEYSRRAALYNHRGGGRLGVVEAGWPMRDLCTENGVGSTPWNPPWDLFLQRCAKLQTNRRPLFVGYDQRAPGYAWTDAGRDYKERTDG